MISLCHVAMLLHRYASLSPEEIPDTESLATTLERVLPYWEKEIVPDIKAGKKVLVRDVTDPRAL